MSKNTIRKDKTCLNCNYVVENRFCPNCGQENADTRKTFHQLFLHFFEDLTHYENAFWKTIKNLLIRPSSLTREYLSGKRLSYLAPVRLYIFISFITFFLITVLPDDDDKNNVNFKGKHSKDKIHTGTKKAGSLTPQEERINALIKTGAFSEKEAQALRDAIKKTDKDINKNDIFNVGYDSIEELDEAHQFGKGDAKVSDFEYFFLKRILLVKQNNTNQEIITKFRESFKRNLPKVLFIYMPIFAFFLWLFQNKKRWYYFDHGIFTLHYFSFLLLITLIMVLFSKVVSLFGDNILTSVLTGIFDFISFGWMFYYFFPAHHRFYGETRWVSFIKGMILFFINSMLIFLIMLIFIVYTFINLH